jgi:hypothetical protein
MVSPVLVPMLAARLVLPVTACDTSLPANVAAATMQPQMLDLARRSVSFRQQCQRIGRTRVLRVTVQLTTAIEGGARAQTVIHRYEAGGLRAEVSLLFGEDYVELLAHEFEHILEQVDGVVLRDEVGAGRAWRTESGAYETRRAFSAGVRARREIDDLTVAASAAAAADAKSRAFAAGRPPRNQRP